MHWVQGGSRMLLRDLLSEDKLLKCTRGMGKLFEMLTTVSVKKQAVTQDEV